VSATPRAKASITRGRAPLRLAGHGSCPNAQSGPTRHGQRHSRRFHGRPVCYAGSASEASHEMLRIGAASVSALSVRCSAASGRDARALASASGLPCLCGFIPAPSTPVARPLIDCDAAVLIWLQASESNAVCPVYETWWAPSLPAM